MSSRVTFWLLIGLIVSVGVGKAVLSDTLDPDLFWHLRVAEQLRADGIGPIVDNLSFSSIKQPWTPYSWLAELGMEWSWNRLGWRSAVIGKAICVGAILVMLALCSQTLVGDERRLNCVLATAFGAFLTIPFLSFRPVTFAILILSIIAWLLLRERRTAATRAVWCIVPLTVLLTNIHLCVIVVPIWVGCLLIGAVVERKDVKHYALLLMATTLACLATPMLAGAMRTAWFYNTADVMVASRIIAEMQPIYGGYGLITGVLLLSILACAIVHRDRVRLGEWLWLASGIVLTLRLGRFAPMLALILAPIAATTIPAMNDRILTRRPVAIMLGVVVAFAFARIALNLPPANMDKWVNRIHGEGMLSFPTAAASYVEQNVPPRSGRLINEFNWGGYLAWRLGDRYQVFLDGRTQLFTPVFWRQTYLGTDEEAARVIKAANADAAVIPARKPRFGKALALLGWQSVYRDEFAEVLVPPK